MSEHEQVAYRLVKKDVRFPGIPARDLAQHEVDGLSGTLHREVLHSGVWMRADEGEASFSGKSRDELNGLAAKLEIERPEELRTKADVITAIETRLAELDGPEQDPATEQVDGPPSDDSGREAEQDGE